MKKIVLGLALSVAATTATTTTATTTTATTATATCQAPARDIIDDAIAGAPLNTDQRKWALTHKHVIFVGLTLLTLHILGERKNNSGFFSWPWNTIPAGCTRICEVNQAVWDYAKEHAGAATLIAITAFFLHDLLLRGDKSYIKLLLGKPVVQGLMNEFDGTPQTADQKANKPKAENLCTRMFCHWG